LKRPVGPLKIESTEVVHKDLLVAKLSGAANTTVAAVKKGKKYFFVAPKSLGGTREVPADSLTDCMNYSVRTLSEIKKALKKKSKAGGKK